jgi:FtsZ-interacting cell division protein ZipA
MPAWLIWVIVIVVVLLIVAAVVAISGRRRTAQRHQRAEELRAEATAQASSLAESQREADELRAKAELARSEADRAEERAATAEQGHQVEQAGYEDKLRDADRVDPDVDHRSGDYEPDVWNDERTETSSGQAGRATATDPSVAEPAATEAPTRHRSEG